MGAAESTNGAELLKSAHTPLPPLDPARVAEVEALYATLQQSSSKYTKEEFIYLYHVFRSIYDSLSIPRSVFISENLFRGMTPRFWGGVFDIMDIDGDGTLDIKDYVFCQTIFQGVKEDEMLSWTFNFFSSGTNYIEKDWLVQDLVWLFRANRDIYLLARKLLNAPPLKMKGGFFSIEEEKEILEIGNGIFDLIDTNKMNRVSKTSFLDVCQKSDDIKQILSIDMSFLQLERSMEALKLSQFSHQVAGHKKVSVMLRSAGKVFKPLSTSEFQFYENIYLQNQCPDLIPFIARYFGRTYLNTPQGISNYLVLEDLTEAYDHPCVCDLKMGTQGHGDDASLYKVFQQTILCNCTTSALLGFRMCGMKVWKPETENYVEYNAFWGAMLNEVKVLDALKIFFTGTTLRVDVITELWTQLGALMTWFVGQKMYRFYSSSILFIYEGNEKLPANPKIRMVDFAHTFRNADENVRDESYLIGLQNLLTTVKLILQMSNPTANQQVGGVLKGMPLLKISDDPSEPKPPQLPEPLPPPPPRRNSKDLLHSAAEAKPLPQADESLDQPEAAYPHEDVSAFQRQQLLLAQQKKERSSMGAPVSYGASLHITQYQEGVIPFPNHSHLTPHYYPQYGAYFDYTAAGVEPRHEMHRSLPTPIDPVKGSSASSSGDRLSYKDREHIVGAPQRNSQ
eukprot:TRINITY_DN13858_c0_g1_i1.p1 TRINITY_DN13858_c0_g1~~TRINITY_DN13858_c0_g1_i1.p1  ORF type:complete len:680 (+),score=133.80 TRINITY_DN13858_c0_g1_i1:316-2355(+)